MKYKDGLILKGIGGFYTVSTDDDCIYTCKARGRFRIDRVTPIVGDRVKIQCDDTDCSGSILEIYPRKSELVRPPVANIDKCSSSYQLRHPSPICSCLTNCL